MEQYTSTIPDTQQQQRRRRGRTSGSVSLSFLSLSVLVQVILIQLITIGSHFRFGVVSFTQIAIITKPNHVRTVIYREQNRKHDGDVSSLKWNDYKRKNKSTRMGNTQSSPTKLNLLLDVPDSFFTITFPMLGLLLSLSKSFVRVRMEELAWEQRIQDQRSSSSSTNSMSSLTELEQRRQEGKYGWSAYGPNPLKQQAQNSNNNNNNQESFSDDDSTSSSNQYGRFKKRVQVMDRENLDDEEEEIEDGTDQSRKIKTMTDDDIRNFEREYGIEYDPYYDEPYTEMELPSGKYNVDKLYGDRIYDNGEIFYKDNNNSKTKQKEEGGSGGPLYWRQGSKPRNIRFWG